MGAPDLLARITAAGLTVEADGDRLLVRPRERLTVELRETIRSHNPELLALLTSDVVTPTPDLSPELDALIRRVASFHGFSDEDLGEARAIAAADVANALTCFRALHAEITR